MRKTRELGGKVPTSSTISGYGTQRSLVLSGYRGGIRQHRHDMICKLYLRYQREILIRLFRPFFYTDSPFSSQATHKIS